MPAFVPASPAVTPRVLRSAFICNPLSTRAVNARPAVSRRCRVVPRMATDTATESASPPSETFEFQAEVTRIMNLIINSLYSNKEVFLRELVSNSSDACDKKRFLSLSAGSESGAPAIHVKADKEAGTITVEDSGVGMTRQELIDNLGSIATSGTSKFLDAIGESSSGDVSLIGKFGVGFYSAFLIADRVTVISKPYTDPKAKQYRWESTATNSYIISEDESETIDGGSGTRIILHVKEDCKDFLENIRLVELMKRYSEFVQFPVYGWETRTEFDEVPDGDEKDADGEQKTKRVPRTVEEWNQVNKTKPLWMRKPKEVKQEEYEQFYKSISRDFNNPLAQTHFAVEGDVEFRALLFTPTMLPPEFRQNMFPDDGRQLRLYVKRVFISDNFEDILPRWLCFMKGVVDSEDLPLNVSREILQKSRVLRIISKRLVRKAVDMFKAIKARDNDDFDKFWAEFGRYLKAGIIEEREHSNDLVKMAMWASTNSSDKLTDLDSYITRMKEKQDAIYFVTAESRTAGESAPAMESLRKLGYEVLFLVEPVDEIAIQNIGNYKAKKNADDKDETTFKFVDVSKEDLNLGDLKSVEEKKEDEELAEDFKAVCEYMTTLLSDKVGKVQISDRLTESVSTITQSSFGISPTMERYMKEVGANTANDPGMASFLFKARALDINPRHPIVRDIKMQLEGAAGNDEQLKQSCMLVYELALLTAGYSLDDTAKFAKRVGSLVSTGVQAPEIIIPPKEEPAPSLEDDPDAKLKNLESSLKDLTDKAGMEMNRPADLTSENLDDNLKNDVDDKGEEKIKKVDTEIVG